MTRVLVVDDSALMRRVLGGILQDEGYDVAFARDGLEALERARSFKPAVITLDVQMPKMDGLSVLDRLMVEQPTPVVMISSLTEEGAETTLQALSLGAVDFIPKPSGVATLHLEVFAPQVLAKVAAAAQVRLPRTLRLRDRVQAKSIASGPDPSRRPPAPGATPVAALFPAAATTSNQAAAAPEGLVLIGTSTGGPPALECVLGGLPADLPWPVLVAQHMPAAFTGSLARRLDKLCGLTVLEVEAPVVLQPGHVYLGRGDADLVVSERGGVAIALPAPSDPSHRWHPSVDRLAHTALEVFEPARLMGVLLTGMGDDGARGFARIRAGGGRVIAQAETDCIIWGMPGSLVKAGGADAISLLADMPDLIASWARRP